MKENGTVLVSDYGLSRILSRDDSYYEIRHSTFPWAWASPEALKTRRFDSRSDIWAFGVALWEIVTKGSSPYHEYVHSPDNNPIRAVIKGDAKLVISPDVRRSMAFAMPLIDTCLRHDPQKRPTAGGLLDFITSEMRSSPSDKRHTCSPTGINAASIASSSTARLSSMSNSTKRSSCSTTMMGDDDDDTRRLLRKTRISSTHARMEQQQQQQQQQQQAPKEEKEGGGNDGQHGGDEHGDDDLYAVTLEDDIRRGRGGRRSGRRSSMQTELWTGVEEEEKVKKEQKDANLKSASAAPSQPASSIDHGSNAVRDAGCSQYNLFQKKMFANMHLSEKELEVALDSPGKAKEGKGRDI